MPGPVDAAAILADPAAHLDAADPALRRIAVAACEALLHRPPVRARLARIVRYDAVAEVRAAAVEALGSGGPSAYADVAPAVDDPDLRVVEAATTALGEIGATEATPWLERAACAHPDRLVREAAVAALGAIGDPDSVPVILDVLRTGPPQVRRRAVVALSVFDHPAVEPALREAARDRNPMVRDVASMLVSPPA